MTGSREISWWSVYLLLAPFLSAESATGGKLPPVIPGTPDWDGLPDDHPDKWRAVLWAAMWWVLDEDGRQDAIAQAGEAVSSAEDWTAVARQVQRRREIDQMRGTA